MNPRETITSIIRSHSLIARSCAAVLATAFAVAPVLAEDKVPLEYDYGYGSTNPAASDLAFGIGYANIGIGGSDSALESEDALRLEFGWSFSPAGDRLPPLRLGIGFGLAAVIDNNSRTIISNGGTTVITGSSDIPLLTLEPEACLSWRQYFGPNFFVEPGIGVGGFFAHLDLEDDDDTDGVDTSIDDWDSSLSGRAFINLGIDPGGGAIGLQASYLRGSSLDFADNASGEVEEFYIGVFGSVRF